MTPTIECFDDQPMQMPPASVLCDNLFFRENHQTSASDRMNPSVDVRTNHWNPYLRNRQSMYNRNRNNSYTSRLRPDVKRLLDNPSSSEEETITEEHLNMLRKRQALFLITIQTMTLFHHNQVLEHKLSALHKRIQQIQERTKNNESTSE